MQENKFHVNIRASESSQSESLAEWPSLISARHWSCGCCFHLSNTINRRGM